METGPARSAVESDWLMRLWLVGSWRALLSSAAIPFDACLTRACLRRDQHLPVDFARPEGLVQAEVSWGQARASAGNLILARAR